MRAPRDSMAPTAARENTHNSSGSPFLTNNPLEKIGDANVYDGDTREALQIHFYAQKEIFHLFVLNTKFSILENRPITEDRLKNAFPGLLTF